MRNELKKTLGGSLKVERGFSGTSVKGLKSLTPQVWQKVLRVNMEANASNSRIGGKKREEGPLYVPLSGN